MTDATMQDAPPQAPASLWEDFIDIFYSPREVFARRQNAKFGLVLLILTLLSTALFFAMQGPLGDAFAAEFQRGMQRAGNDGPQLSAEQQEGARRIGTIFGTLAVLIGFPLAVAAIGVVLWGLGKMFGFAASVGMAILIVTYAQFPRIIQSVLMLLQGLLLQPDSLAATSVGPARFLDPDTAPAIATILLMRLDVFYIWSTILIAIGAQVIGKVPKAQSYILAVLCWIVGALPQLPAVFMG
jgi:hypothetical protein